MDTIQDTILQYNESCDRLKARIQELCDQISGREPLDQECIKALEARRYRLYCQVSEMQRSVAAMRDYVQAIEKCPSSDCQIKAGA